MEIFEKPLNSKVIFDGKVVKLTVDDVLLPSGRKTKREVVNHPAGVGILTFYEDKVVLVKQYRYAFRSEMIEIPAGKIEINEDPAFAGIRELHEETGFVTNDLVFLGEFYPSCGYTNEVIYCYYTTVQNKEKMHLDLDEFINVELWTFDEFEKKILSNEIKDSKTIFSYYRYMALRKSEI